MSALFIVGLLLNLVGPWVVAAWLRRRWELDAGFFGLVFLGAAAAVVAYLGAMGSWLAWLWVFPLPGAMPRLELVQRADVLILTTVVLGISMELVKCYAVELFRTRMTRGTLPMMGVGVGLGAGMLQALLVLGATFWAWLAGAASPGLEEVVLCAKHVALTGLHVAASMWVMLRTAEGRRLAAIAEGGSLHGMALLTAGLFALRGGSAALLGGVVLAGFAGAVGMMLWDRVKRRGWPI